jgi:hypothetical protein
MSMKNPTYCDILFNMSPKGQISPLPIADCRLPIATQLYLKYHLDRVNYTNILTDIFHQKLTFPTGKTPSVHQRKVFYKSTKEF